MIAGGSAAQLLAGCAAATAYRVTPAGGVLRLDLTSFPELQRAIGIATLQADGDEAPMFVVRQNETYTALSAVCTHRGCTVEAKSGRFVCPCHGSTYAVTGAVLRGPAEQPLRRIPSHMQADGRTLIVEHRRGTESR